MKFRLIDLPRKIDLPEYQDSIGEMLQLLTQQEAVKTIFQIGGVSSPGISDIDLYVIFHNGTSLQENPVKQMKGTPAYLFTHNLFGTEESLAVQMEPFTFFGKYHLLEGEQTEMHSNVLAESDRLIVEKQVALEYLAKAYLSISVSLTSGIVKARNILLHAKALLLDLKLLGMDPTTEGAPIQAIVDLRKKWYNEHRPENELHRLIPSYQESLKKILGKGVREHGFFVLPETDREVAKNMTLTDNSEIKVSHRGLKIPSYLTTRSRRFLQVHRRFGKHELSLPLSTDNIPEILIKRTHLFRSAEQLNKERFPGFLPTAYGLNLFKPVHS